MKRLNSVKGLIALVSAVSLVACLDASGPGASDPAGETFATSLGLGNITDTTVWKRGPNGTYYRDDVVGTGALLELDSPGDSLFVDYSGWLKDGNLFDSGTNTGFRAGNIIVGFLDGMVGMRKGGTRTVVIPSNLGFGNTRTGSIPPNSTLIFRIKLNEFTNGA